MVDAHLDPATRDFNLDQHRGSDLTPEGLASLLATPPMMADWRVVVVRDAQGLSPRAREAVLAAAATPPPGLALVVSAAIPPGSRARFYRDLGREAEAAEFESLDATSAPGWVMERAREAHQVEIGPEAARRLVSSVGSDLGTLDAELAKLTVRAGVGGRIGEEDVRELTRTVRSEDRWQWFDLVGEGRFAEARARLPGLLDGEGAVRVVAGMGTHLLRIGIVVSGGRDALAGALGRYQRWLVGRLAAQARNWTAPAVDAGLSALLHADHLLKSARVDDRVVIDRVLAGMQLAAPARKAS